MTTIFLVMAAVFPLGCRTAPEVVVPLSLAYMQNGTVKYKPKGFYQDLCLPLIAINRHHHAHNAEVCQYDKCQSAVLTKEGSSVDNVQNVIEDRKTIRRACIIKGVTCSMLVYKKLDKQITHKALHPRLDRLLRQYKCSGGVAHGEYREWHRNGNAKVVGTISNNNAAGIWRFYHDTGSIRRLGLDHRFANRPRWMPLQHQFSPA